MSLFFEQSRKLEASLSGAKSNSLVTVGYVEEMILPRIRELAEQLRKMNVIRPTPATEAGLKALTGTNSEVKSIVSASTPVSTPQPMDEEHMENVYTSRF